MFFIFLGLRVVILILLMLILLIVLCILLIMGDLIFLSTIHLQFANLILRIFQVEIQRSMLILGYPLLLCYKSNKVLFFLFLALIYSLFCFNHSHNFELKTLMLISFIFDHSYSPIINLIRITRLIVIFFKKLIHFIQHINYL